MIPEISDAYVLMLATRAHLGQVDKSGKPYINHPVAVSEIVTRVPSYAELTEAERVVARWSGMLHDVLEDCPDFTEEGLLALGVPEAVTHVVKLLSRNISTESYYENIAKDRVARVVKLADAFHNSDPDRMVLLDAKTVARLRSKYIKGAKLLTTQHPGDLTWFVLGTAPAESGWNG